MTARSDRRGREVGSMLVGGGLRRRRQELGHSLRELAELTDLSTGFLSQLENDQVSPSLASLDRICQALRLPMFELLSSDARDPVVRATERPTLRLGTDGPDVEVLTNFLNWQMLPFHRTIAPGETYSAVRIERAREEWMYVLAGEMEIQLLDHEPRTLRAGDSIHFASNRLEKVVSVGDEPLELIGMMTPPAY